MANKKWGRNKQIQATIELKQKRRFKTMLHDAVMGYVCDKLIVKKKAEKPKEPIEKPEKTKKASGTALPRKGIINAYRRIYHGDIHQCVYCGEDIYCVDSEDYTLDHLVPYSLGGNNYEINLKPCCHKCNVEKAGFTIDEWLNILQREFERSGESDPQLFYKFMRVRDVKRYVDRMGELLYRKND